MISGQTPPDPGQRQCPATQSVFTYSAPNVVLSRCRAQVDARTRCVTRTTLCSMLGGPTEPAHHTGATAKVEYDYDAVGQRRRCCNQSYFSTSDSTFGPRRTANLTPWPSPDQKSPQTGRQRSRVATTCPGQAVAGDCNPDHDEAASRAALYRWNRTLLEGTNRGESSPADQAIGSLLCGGTVQKRNSRNRLDDYPGC